MTLQALVPSLKPAPCNIYDETTKCEKVEGGNAALLYVAMYFVALGLSGIRSSGPVHGADQFDQNDPKEVMQMLGLGFGISTIASLMCAIVFFCGMPRYRIQLVQKTDAVIELFQVFVAAFRNRNLHLPQNHEELYEIDRVQETSEELEFLPHKDRLRFLDKATIQTSDSPNPWRLCRVTQVENAKMFLSIFPVFCCTILMSAGQAQMTSFSIHQGLTMGARIIGDFKVPPGSLPLIPVVSLIFIIPMYERFFIPFARKITGVPTGITYLQRIGGGLFLAMVAMAAAEFVEVRRKELAKSLGMLDAVPGVQSLPMNILWLAFQQAIYSVSEMFTNTGLQ
ncbi:protein NRT1/ PTR FAMILY 4.5-like protein [Cinnamomum micranthum f. kanehirae]|uniref:Protein NRT1/ PTR FAMILY 4.5-like protein n=1 Tax=Cinnamomum micranthum f. kanehirae TaxID=337451 RepID=A0A443Q325_9MAGN|nr:protein NRT1/ PTR FAMILY 4.5-like protein [Cinnamomum micranthum f. kanehirae]